MVYANFFLDLVTSNVPRMAEIMPLRNSRGGIDLGYRENDLRSFIQQSVVASTLKMPKDCPQLVVERKLPNDPNNGCVDYCFIRGSELSLTSLLATCELKGPARKAFLDLRRFGVNWSRVFVRDVEKQLLRATTMPRVEHYIALLLPLTEDFIRSSSFPEIVNRTVEAVPGAHLVECACKEVQLRLPLTTFIFRVQPLEGLKHNLLTSRQ
jgi:hypothetical protein